MNSLLDDYRKMEREDVNEILLAIEILLHRDNCSIPVIVLGDNGNWKEMMLSHGILAGQFRLTSQSTRLQYKDARELPKNIFVRRDIPLPTFKTMIRFSSQDLSKYF